MGFRESFKNLVGERVRVKSVSKIVPATNVSALAGLVSEFVHNSVKVSSSSRTDNAFGSTSLISTAREKNFESSASDPMKLAQSRLAAKRRSRLIVRRISQYGYNGYGGAFSPGEIVSFERDSSNPHDSNAVKVFLSDGIMLGFVAQEMAATLSEDLKNGWTYLARIAERPYIDDKLGQCELEVLGKNPPERKMSEFSTDEECRRGIS